MNDSEFFKRDLPKWPACVVVGKRISREQAQEILIRTDSWNIFTNDREWKDEVHRIAGLECDENGHVNWGSLDRFRERHHILDIYFMHNERIASAYIGGPYGWCTWDGAIGQIDKNIGKWPSVEAVYEEWAKIAEAFPFLKLRCQLFNGEAGEDCEAVVEYQVEGGTVSMANPQLPLSSSFDANSLIQRFNSPYRERGVSSETLKAAIQLVRSKFPEVRK